MPKAEESPTEMRYFASLRMTKIGFFSRLLVINITLFVMHVLGIETSCDETSAAVVRDGNRVLSNVTASSLSFHRRYGGVIPEIAFRMQLGSITGVCDCALNEAGIGLGDIGLIAVTNGPGLSGSLNVGVNFAKSAALSAGIPLTAVNHLQGHIYANFLCHSGIRLPFIALIVSGGHTGIYYVNDCDDMEELGSTADDACGEAYDKVAKILGFGYPGGPVIERRAAESSGKSGIKFNCAAAGSKYGFSFSGIKTAVLYYVAGQSRKGPLPPDLANDIAYAFQEAVAGVLVEKTLSAARDKKTAHILVGGGVAANLRLRQGFETRAAKLGLRVFFPEKRFCLDNGAMIAGLGYRLYRKGRVAGPGLELQLD